MLTRDQMPDDNAKLAAIPVDLPSLPDDRLPSPSGTAPDLLDYLRREGFPPDGGLRFLRNARVGRTVYLIWAFESDGEPAYATASVCDREWTLGGGANPWGLTPEQYILADYHDCL